MNFTQVSQQGLSKDIIQLKKFQLKILIHISLKLLAELMKISSTNQQRSKCSSFSQMMKDVLHVKMSMIFS